MLTRTSSWLMECSSLQWNINTDHRITKALQRLYFLRQLRNFGVHLLLRSYIHHGQWCVVRCGRMDALTRENKLLRQRPQKLLATSPQERFLHVEKVRSWFLGEERFWVLLSKNKSILGTFHVGVLLGLWYKTRFSNHLLAKNVWKWQGS